MFFKKKNHKEKDNDLAKVAALLIHAAKIDENYSQHEEEIIKKALLEIGTNEHKIEIVETLWRIIYSNKDADIYETNLMRRLGGLMYIDNKIMGDIKEKIKKEYQ